MGKGIRKNKDMFGQGRYLCYTIDNMPAKPLAFGNAYLWRAFFVSSGG